MAHLAACSRPPAGSRRVARGTRNSETRLWRHNEGDGVSNHWRLDCLLNQLFRGRSKNKTNASRLPLRVSRYGLRFCPPFSASGRYFCTPPQKKKKKKKIWPCLPFYSDLVGSHFKSPHFSACRRSFWWLFNDFFIAGLCRWVRRESV